MKHTSLGTALAMVLTVLPAMGAAPQATTQPTTRPAPKLLTGAVDPYDQADERNRFLTAAGNDNELSAKEFEHNRGMPNAFTRPFDSWKALLAYDKNRNGKIDWFEAEAYRWQLRKNILAAFDANKDGKLSGAERDKANRALARGLDDKGDLVAAVTNKAATIQKANGKAGQDDPRGPKGWQKRYAAMIRRYDKDGDGDLNEKERQAAFREIAEQARQRELSKFDLNGDGKLDDEERQAMQKTRKRLRDEATRQIALVLVDDDGNGVIDENEEKAFQEFGRKSMAVQQKMIQRVMDIDGDGKVSDDERRKGWQMLSLMGLRIHQKMQTWADTNGDGSTSFTEQEDFQDRMRVNFTKWTVQFARRFDADRNGRLDAKERDAMVKGIEGFWEKRLRKVDVNGNGRPEPAELESMVDDFFEEIGVAPEKPSKAAAGAKGAPARETMDRD